jgi:endogenous inhibitor of DNA gyrase (YacG/DUF329 family)
MPEAPAMCVYCRVRPIEVDWRPFCSQRCKLLDLARWADGGYHVAGDPADSADTVEDHKSET